KRVATASQDGLSGANRAGGLVLARDQAQGGLPVGVFHLQRGHQRVDLLAKTFTHCTTPSEACPMSPGTGSERLGSACTCASLRAIAPHPFPSLERCA